MAHLILLNGRLADQRSVRPGWTRTLNECAVVLSSRQVAIRALREKGVKLDEIPLTHIL